MAGGYQVNADALSAYAKVVQAQGDAVNEIIQSLQNGHVAGNSMGELPESDAARSMYAERVSTSLSDLQELAQYLDQTSQNLQGSAQNYTETDQANSSALRQAGGGL